MSEEPKLNDADDFFDGNVPWADADIRHRYEAALGACMLAFNQLDNLLGKVLKTILVRIRRQDLEDECVSRANFSQRVRVLDLLKHTTEGTGIADVSIADLRGVAEERNMLAHAHFEQNPFSGEYWLVGKGKTVQQYTAARIDSVASRIAKVWMTLHHAEAFYDFH